MNALPSELQAAAPVAARGPARSNGAGTAHPTSNPVSPQQAVAGRNGASGRKRTIDAAFGSDVKVEDPHHSPDSLGDGFEDKDESRIGVKRACNECRQQKVRLDLFLSSDVKDALGFHHLLLHLVRTARGAPYRRTC